MIGSPIGRRTIGLASFGVGRNCILEFVLNWLAWLNKHCRVTTTLARGAQAIGLIIFCWVMPRKTSSLWEGFFLPWHQCFSFCACNRHHAIDSFFLKKKISVFKLTLKEFKSVWIGKLFIFSSESIYHIYKDQRYSMFMDRSFSRTL